jgi:hypothetical protein
MSSRSTGKPNLLALRDVADALGLPRSAVEALAAAGYLAPALSGPDGPFFPVSDV